jgi:hypothetical protein
MKKFEVTRIQQIEAWVTVEVTAESAEEALAIAQEAYDEGRFMDDTAKMPILWEDSQTTEASPTWEVSEANP